MRWQVGTVVDTIVETPRAVTLRLDVPEWPGHRAGQHVDIRLTAEDGYSAQRSYSIASPPGGHHVDVTVARIDDGEVSPYLTLDVEVADQIELRGPIGGYFVWDAGDATPVLLVAGGSGVVPLMSMLRHNTATGARTPMRLVYSARTLDDVIYGEELRDLADAAGGPDIEITLTRERSSEWTGRRGRVDSALLGDTGWAPSSGVHCYVCGPTPFVEAVAGELVALGHEPRAVKTERFGPTGG
jgi:ferredoxin-NADP reductase